MALYCNLCGVRTDGTRRLGVYCPGSRCGTDLRAVAHGGVQAWCEPERQNGRPGRAATIRLTVRNANDTADAYRVDPIEPVEGRLEFDEAAVAAPLAPGGVRTVELRYTPPRDRVGLGLDIASRFGVPGADLAGDANDAAGARFGVALRVASRTNPQAACAAFAIDVPGRGRGDRPEPDGRGGASTPGMPLLIGAVVLVLIAVAAVVALNGGNGSDTNAGSDGPRPGVTAPEIVGGGSDLTTPPTTPPTKPGGGKGEGNGNGGKSVPPGPDITTPPVSPRRQVTMRDLYGLSVDDAKRELAEDGLRAKVVVDEHTGTPKGNVRATEPEEGTLVDVGSSVVLHVSDGKFQLDNYVGQNVDTAAAALRGLGLQPVTATSTADLAVPHRQVVATSPAADSWVSEGDVVTLSIHYEPLT